MYLSNKKVNSILIKLFYLLVVLLSVTLTGYRLKIWINDYMSLSSKYYISSVLTKKTSSKLRPTITICNINPAKGSLLLNKSADTGSPQNYELFVDTLNGRNNREVPATRLMTPYFQILDKSSHKLSSMLQYCTVGNRRCTHYNFTKSLLPTGACYTYNGHLSAHEDISLILDPEIHEYVIPNSGFAGFRLLIHSFNDPLWVGLQNSLLVGPNFHTYVRANLMAKRYKRHCVSQNYWILCMHQCLEKSIYKYCQCYLMGSNACTLSRLMSCRMNMDKLTESLRPDNCDCTKRCEQVNYRLESITQSVKNRIFSIFKPPWLNNNRHQASSKSIYRRQVRYGRNIQFWAYLREANNSAFKQLRNISIELENYLMAFKEIETNFANIKKKLEIPNRKLCFGDNNINNLYKSGTDFFRVIRKKPIIHELENSLPKIVHIHLVDMLFKSDTVVQLKQMETYIDQDTHFVSLLNILNVKQNCTRFIEDSPHGNSFNNYLKFMENNMMKFLTTSHKFIRNFLTLIKHNRGIISRISNLTDGFMDSEYNKKNVALTVQVLQSDHFGYELESAQNMYDPHLAIIDIIISGLVISFVFITLANRCLKIKKTVCLLKANGVDRQNETIQNNLSSSTYNGSQKPWIQPQFHTFQSHPCDQLDGSVTTFHMI